MAEPVLSPLKVVSLFAGVGGIDLAAEHNGLTTALVCEIDKPCRTVLAERFPTATIHDDVRTLTADDLRAAGAVPGRSVIVRRLTPLECERLQGFPDRWTDVPGTSDSQRYKQMGNSVAVPVFTWTFGRLVAVDALLTADRLNGCAA